MTLPKLIPKLMPNAYYPDVFKLQLRMDAPASDALAHLELTNNAHAEIIERLLVFKNYYPLFFETTEESSSPIIGLDIVKQLQKRLPFQTSKLSDTEKQKISPLLVCTPNKRLCNNIERGGETKYPQKI